MTVRDPAAGPGCQAGSETFRRTTQLQKPEKTMPGGLACYIFGGFLLLMAVVAHFTARSKAGMPKNAWLALLTLGGLAIIWGLCGGFYAIYMFTDRIRAIRSMDANNIVAVEVLPTRNQETYPSLVRKKIRLTDKQAIKAIVKAIKSGKPWTPNHPSSEWHCILQIDDSSRKHSFYISSTSDNGLLITVFTAVDQGLLLGVYRQDGLTPILQRIAAAEK